jgi:hypothetical protein
LPPMNNHVLRQKALNFVPMNNLFVVPKTLADAILFVTTSQYYAFFADSTADNLFSSLTPKFSIKNWKIKNRVHIHFR